MNDRLITKNKNLAIKFIAVVLMIVLHTFSFPERIKNVEYISIYLINGIPIEYYVGRFGAICVGIYLFLSGYGLYISYNERITYKGIAKRIYKLYLNYWIIFLIFIPIGIILKRYSFDIENFILNFIGVKDSYNGEWWFLRLYIMLLLLYPIFIKYINKYNKNTILILSFIINIVGYGLTKIMYILRIDSFIISSIILILGGQFLFMLGIIVCKYALFNKLNEKIGWFEKFDLAFLIIIILIIMVTVDIPVLGEVLNLISIPIFIFTVSKIISEKTILSILGKHSTNIWLMHSFFCYYLFQKFTFISKNPIVIILQQIIVTVIISIIINKILNLISSININKREEIGI